MKQIQYQRFSVSLPVAEKASTAKPELVTMTTLATSAEEAKALARDAGLVLHGQFMSNGAIKPC